jgi:hypothetical protein
MGVGDLAQCQGICLASIRPWVPAPVPEKKDD